MSKIHAVVFDIDGTILDTSEFIMRAYEHVIKMHNFPGRTRADISSQIGKKIEDCYAFLTPGADYQNLITDHDVFQAGNLALVQAYEHVRKTIEVLHDVGIKVGLWTGRRHYVVESLEKVGFNLEMFDCLVEASEVKKGKPDPEGLITTLQRLGTEANLAVMVGDAGVDIEAGKAAGVAVTIGLTHGFGTRQELEIAGADYILDSLKTLPDLISKIE